MSSQGRSEKIRKTELVKEMHQLKLNADKLEREKGNHIYNKHSEFSHEFAPLQDIDRKQDKDLRAERKSTEQLLLKMKNQVAKFRREVKEVKPTPEFVEKIKILMEDIESQINSFKENQRQQYDQLMQEERVVNQEVLAIEKRLEAWSQMEVGPQSARKGTQLPGNLPSHRDVHRNLPPEVTAFERFEAQTGGQRGGWDEYDHSMFMKYRNRHKGKPSFIQDLVVSLPTKNETEIRQHEAWFREYEMLRERKKEAIAKWKEDKELEKKEASDSETDEEMDQQLKAEREKQEAEERAAAKMQLSRWKVEKELKKAEEEERKLRQEMKAQEEREAKKKRQEEIKAKVMEYKQVKSAEERERQVAEEARKQVEMEEKHRVAKVIIGQFKDRDLEKTYQKRNSRQEAKERAELEKQKRLAKLKSQVEVRVERDPSRLLQPTSGWIERQKESVEPSLSGRVLHMPHRAVPTWRQNMH